MTSEPRGEPAATTDAADGRPDRIAIDADGFGWRAWDDETHLSMVPVNPDNSAIPQPLTWYVRWDRGEARRSVEDVVQRAIEEWATIAGGPDADLAERVTLAQHVATHLVWEFGR